MTQSRLLDIAIREFGSKGLEGSSTRSIAAAAGTAMSAITYHYGGKEGLYLAAADHIAARMAEEMMPAFAAGETSDEADPVEARAAIHRLLGRFFDKMASDDTAAWSLFIMREQLTPGDAFERIHVGLMGRILMRLTDLIRVATGVADPVARVTTLTLIGQALVVRASRASVLRMYAVDQYDAATLAHIQARLSANTDAILDRLIAEERP